jgi:Tol biopolymer transport system component
MKSIIVFLLALAGLGSLLAQADSDIYLLEVQSAADGLAFSQARNLTPRKGYDNQPSFTPDGQGLLYVSIGNDGQADVYEYLFTRGSAIRLTETKKTSEYSPTVMPKGKHFSALVVEEDSSQRIWKYGMEGGKGEVLIEGVKGIGYYSFYHKKRLAAFVLGDPFTLQAIHLKKQKPELIAENIGRAVQTHPLNGEISFVDQSDSTRWVIRSWNPKSKVISEIVPTLPGSEDYCWTPEGHLLMGKGTQLYRFRPGTDTDWQLQGDLGIGEFYRLAMSPDGSRLAVVTR